MTAQLSTPHPSQNLWRDVYVNAVLETDNSKMSQLIKLAEQSILARRSALNGCAEDEAERRELDKALAGLAILQRERLGT